MSSPTETPSDPPRPPPPDIGGETQTAFHETEIQSPGEETETQSAAQEAETQLRGQEQDSGPDVPVTPVNGQVTDALNQAMAALLAGAPALLAQALEQVTAQSVGLAMLNAVQAQQSAALIATATVTRAAARIAGPREAGVPPHV